MLQIPKKLKKVKITFSTCFIAEAIKMQNKILLVCGFLKGIRKMYRNYRGLWPLFVFEHFWKPCHVPHRLLQVGSRHSSQPQAR